MGQAETLGDSGSDADRPIRAGRNQPVDLERRGNPLDPRLVLGREQAAPVGMAKARGGGIAVDDGDPETSGARSFEQPELSRAAA
jgi:hypothetical protein